MLPQEAKQILLRQIQETHPLRTKEPWCDEFKKWKRDTGVAIRHIFTPNAHHKEEFESVEYAQDPWYQGTPCSKEHFIKGLDTACALLDSMMREIDDFGLAQAMEIKSTDAISAVELLCNRFHLICRQLRSRHGDRETINVSDEYDVQDLLHALLHLHFNDIRPEEWTPSYAGACSRVDFLLKQEKAVIEVKKTRKGLSAKQIGEQLIIDIQRYQKHPDCKCLVCFVYDPDGLIANPRGLENDLNREAADFKVIVKIAP